ncbi:MAG: hypothetical protein POELPBGB_00749 [Bacteroidia bacterium]|nr:hypothetical protein [Bacteroidia bacterium]
MKRPFFLYMLCIVHLLVGLNAAAGGVLMMLKPDGALLGMKQEWLANSPFENYFIPGLLLFFMLGIFSLFTVWGLLRKPQLKVFNVLNIYPDMHWAWAYSLYSGIITITWILIQMLLTQYFWLQPLIIFFGLLVIVFTLIPGVITCFKKLS